MYFPPPFLSFACSVQGRMNRGTCLGIGPMGLNVELHDMLKWPIKGTDIYKTFVSDCTLYDAFAFVGYATLRMASNMI